MLDLNRIINIDETPVFLELVVDKADELKGAKNAIIKEGGNYKSHVTVILAVTSSCNKLPSVLIFKGMPIKNNEKRYNKLDVLRKKIFISFQENDWVNDIIFKEWIDLVFYCMNKN